LPFIRVKICLAAPVWLRLLVPACPAYVVASNFYCKIKVA